MVTVRMRPDSRYVAERLAARWQQAVTTLPTFVSVSFFFDDIGGVYGYYSVWNTREDAENVTEEIGDQVAKAVAEVSTGENEVRVYYVYQPPS